MKYCPICKHEVKGNRKYCTPECSKEADKRKKKEMYGSLHTGYRVINGVARG